MHLIKLSAIDSTNNYLKNLVRKTAIEDYTVVLTDSQTEGRGQMGTKWKSEKGKNLTFSILINFDNLSIDKNFYVSMAISLAVFELLNDYVKNMLFIKWPNDIMSANNKIAGILIENSVSGNLLKHSIVGIGINVNQEVFPSDLPNVSSLKNIIGEELVLEALLTKLVKLIKTKISILENGDYQTLKNEYLNRLYRYNVKAKYKSKEEGIFSGKITDVAENGQLCISTETGKQLKFNLKEIEYL